MGECLIIRSGGGTDTSDATATSDVVLSGYTCYVNDELVTGSMVAQNPGNQSLTPGGEYTIEEGYYDGTDEISVTSLSDNTSANATAGYILTGYNAWVNGSNVSGSMANQGNVSQSLAANGSYTIPAGWHAGAGVVNQSLATQGAVNVTPGTANKTACAANRWTTGSIIILGSSSLVASNIRNGVTIFGVTGTWQGYVDANYYVINTTYNINEYRSGDTDWSTLRTHTISSDVVSDLRRSYSWLTYECDINIAFVRVTSGLRARTASARIRVSRPHDGGITIGGIASTGTVMGNVQGASAGRGTSSDSGSATVRTDSGNLNSLSLIIQYDASSSLIVCRVWSTYIRAYFHN